MADDASRSGEPSSVQHSAPGALTRPAPMCCLGSQTQEVGALRILDHAHAPGLHHVEGVGVDVGAQLGAPGPARRVGILDGDV